MPVNPNAYSAPDPWEEESSSSSLEQLLQEAHDLEPWLLPSFKLEDKRELPSDKKGVYFAHMNKVVLYVGKTESSTGFNGRWVNHQTFEALQRYQEVSGHPVRIAYWHIPERQFIGQIESHLIRMWQPLLNKAGVSKELRAIVNRYQEHPSTDAALAAAAARVARFSEQSAAEVDKQAALVQQAAILDLQSLEQTVEKTAQDIGRRQATDLMALKDELNNEVLEVSRCAVEAFTRSIRLENFLISSGLAACFAFFAITPFFRLNLLASAAPQIQSQPR